MPIVLSTVGVTYGINGPTHASILADLHPEKGGREIPLSRERRSTACVLLRLRYGVAAWPSTVRLMEARAASSDERVLSTTIFRSIDPLKPVRPSCSEPLSVMR